MAVAAQTEYVNRVARNVIVMIAPDELPQFDSTARAFNAASWRQRRRAARRNEALGIGVDGLLGMLTIAVLYVLSRILEKIADHYSEKAADTVRLRIRRWLRRILRRPRQMPAPWNPTREQLAVIRTTAVREARAFGLTAAQADMVTDRIIAELAAPLEKSGSAVTDARTDA